jgi:hypothetical protein
MVLVPSCRFLPQNLIFDDGDDDRCRLQGRLYCDSDGRGRGHEGGGFHPWRRHWRRGGGVCGGTDADRDTAARKERKGHDEQLRDETPPEKQRGNSLSCARTSSNRSAAKRKRTIQALPGRYLAGATDDPLLANDANGGRGVRCSICCTRTHLGGAVRHRDQPAAPGQPLTVTSVARAALCVGGSRLLRGGAGFWRPQRASNSERASECVGASERVDAADRHKTQRPWHHPAPLCAHPRRVRPSVGPSVRPRTHAAAAATESRRSGVCRETESGNSISPSKC